MATLKELSVASGVQEIAPGRTVGEQRDAGMYASGELQYDDVAPADYGFTGQIQDGSKFQDPFYAGLQRLTQPIGSFFNKYGAPVMGGIMSLATNIPGLNFLTNNFGSKPYDDNLINMYGGYGLSGKQDKFGYNTVSLMDNYMQPGSSSFRSAALEGLRGLDQDTANNFYQDTYGLTFDQVRDSIRDKENPFGPQPENIGTSDYFGGNGGIGSAGGGEASPGSAGPGGSDAMGSF